RVDAEVLLDLRDDGVGQREVRIVRVGPAAIRFAISGAGATRPVDLPVGRNEDRAVVGQVEQMVVLILVHLYVVSIELVERDDELVRVSVVVVGGDVENVAALHVAGGDRDAVAVVVHAVRDPRRFAAARGHAGRTGAASAGAGAPTRAASCRARAATAS